MKLIRAILELFGGTFVGLIFHELYHFLTLKNVSQVCLNFGDNTSLAYVRGNGFSSEIIGNGIMFTFMILGLIFAIYDLKRK